MFGNRPSRAALWFFVALATSLGATAGFGADLQIAGAWEMREGDQAIRFVFDPNGGGSMNGIPLQWSLQNGELRLVMEDEGFLYRAAVVGGELHLSGGDLPHEVILRRVGDESAGRESAASSDARIQGRWQASNGSVVEFRADGSGTNMRGQFHYKAVQGVLVFDDGSGGLRLEYEIDGDRLVFTSNGAQETFVRARAGAAAPSPQTVSAKRKVVVNRTKLTEKEVRNFEAQFRVRMLDGKYWYDAACGAWGFEGGPCVGFLPPKLKLGGTLAVDASGGGTQVFINGRELHPMDVASLQRLGPVQPGRYWLDALGNCGYEGNPIPIANLVQLANAARSSSGGSYHSRSNITGIGSGGDGHTSYVMGKDWNVIVGE